MSEPVKIGRATLYLGDCRDILPTLGKVDAVVTDPPYGIGVGSMSMGKGKKVSSFNAFAWDDAPPDMATINAALALASHSVVWGGNYFTFPASKCWLAWDKVQEFSGADFELAWTNLDKPSKAFRLSRVEAYGQVERLHPTQKPLPLMKWCIGHLTNPAPQTILDPFMGSGTTGVAAVQMGRDFIGIEREPKYFDIACKRIEDAQRQGDLFIGNKA